MASLDPRLPVCDILAEPLRTHGCRKADASRRVRELLRAGGPASPSTPTATRRSSPAASASASASPARWRSSRSCSCWTSRCRRWTSRSRPASSTCSTSSRPSSGCRYLFVAHDLSVVRHIADRVAVMYLGRIVEIGDVDAVFDAPAHPVHPGAAVGDPAARPAQGAAADAGSCCTGDLPSPANPPSGCRFRTRCPKFADELERRRAAAVHRQSPILDPDGTRPPSRLPLRRTGGGRLVQTQSTTRTDRKVRRSEENVVRMHTKRRAAGVCHLPRRSP